jgi:tRNA (guanine6-N2)-methyltransferase
MESLRAGRGVYLVHTQPGFEPVAWSEISARVEGARRIGTRSVPDRAGMLVFEAPHPERLASLRTVEDVFAVVAYRRELPADKSALVRIAATVRGTTHIDDALAARTRVTPGSRSGHRLRFKVIARIAGEHEFRRLDFKRAIENAVAERGDHSWRLDETAAEVELWATMLHDELIVALRLSDDRMRQREYKAVHLPGSLRPSVAAALAFLSDPKPEDVFLDPMCGAGTVLIERAHLGRYAMLLGGDSEPETIAAARENIGPRYKPIELRMWDAAALALPDASVDKIVTNLPWGIKHGSHRENRRLYPRLLAEFNRVLKPGGTMVLLTAETQLMRELWRDRIFRPSRVMQVSVLGAPAAVYLSARAAA